MTSICEYFKLGTKTWRDNSWPTLCLYKDCRLRLIYNKEVINEGYLIETDVFSKELNKESYFICLTCLKRTVPEADAIIAFFAK